jgi:hypothetical protein
VAPAPIECGPGRGLLLALGALHLGCAAVVAVSALDWPLTCTLLALICVSLWRLWRVPRCWLWRNGAGWWTADGEPGEWQGPWQIGAGSYLGRHLAILSLRRDRRRKHCIISVEGLGPDAWRRLRRDLGHP